MIKQRGPGEREKSNAINGFRTVSRTLLSCTPSSLLPLSLSFFLSFLFLPCSFSWHSSLTNLDLSQDSLNFSSSFLPSSNPNPPTILLFCSCLFFPLVSIFISFSLILFSFPFFHPLWRKNLVGKYIWCSFSLPFFLSPSLVSSGRLFYM